MNPVNLSDWIMKNEPNPHLDAGQVYRMAGAVLEDLRNIAAYYNGRLDGLQRRVETLPHDPISATYWQKRCEAIEKQRDDAAASFERAVQERETFRADYERAVRQREIETAARERAEAAATTLEQRLGVAIAQRDDCARRLDVLAKKIRDMKEGLDG